MDFLEKYITNIFTILAYSESMKSAIWTSFTATTKYQSSPENLDWSSDVRLEETNTAKCSDFSEHLAVNGTLLAPLFPPGKLTKCFGN